ncbi:site-specific integrase [uncultured Draconibacterium sp.]|uniref:site-specific integrase n=1 Tax=uncultured Draconibacterium sp. TaxID=1573823 RepID=UPI002AA8D43A|nr:site-specific integrase [uncultured Draconibacterium sp.]
MKSTFKILFYARKNYVTKDGDVGIMVRISLNGQRTQFSTKLLVPLDLWDTAANRLSGKSHQARLINDTLDGIRTSINTHYRELEKKESVVTVEKIKNAFLGLTGDNQRLLAVFEEHNKQIEKLIGISKSKDTVQKYWRTYTRLKAYIDLQYKLEDIPLVDINYNFIVGYDNFLRAECSLGVNSAAKMMQMFKHIMIMAKNNGWVYTDPFANYKIRLEKVDRGFLLKEELERIMEKKFSIKRLEQVRDVFVFACFTGLAFVDVYKLRERHITTSFDQKLWIMKKRQKTNIESRILLLDVLKMILDKYKGKLEKRKVLPTLSNQKMNAYLKEIADLCGIKKNLTFHVARHTFATTITLAKGVPIETVSKMLGHTNIKTTQIYARITDEKIGNDMTLLSHKLAEMGNRMAI